MDLDHESSNGKGSNVFLDALREIDAKYENQIFAKPAQHVPWYLRLLFPSSAQDRDMTWRRPKVTRCKQLESVEIELQCIPSVRPSSQDVFHTEEEFGERIHSYLRELCQNGAKEDGPRVSRNAHFDGFDQPEMLLPLIFRLVRSRDLSHSVFIAALILLRRYQECTQEPVLSVNVEKLFLTSVILSAKFLEDVQTINSSFLQCGVFSGFREINFLEKKFLEELCWNVYISVSEFSQFEREFWATVSPNPKECNRSQRSSITEWSR